MLTRPSFLMPLLAAWVFQAVTVTCGFDPSAQNNLAVYWGQNSINRPTGQAGAQQRLSTYCSESSVNVGPDRVPIEFAPRCLAQDTFPSRHPFSKQPSPESRADEKRIPTRQDIQACQAKGKTILLSIGGATYTEGGFRSETEAVAAADKVWATFGPVQAGDATTLRPFGAAVVDGFDLDFESPLSNLLPFARRLRALTTNGAGGQPPRRFYLTAAPQCFLPDAALDVLLSSDVVLDFVMVQFYNNWCGAHNFRPGVDDQPIFNLAQWDAWSASRTGGRTKILVGVPGRAGAAGSGYVDVSALAAVITYARRFASFAGVMVWDASQAWANAGWLDGVAAALGGGGGGQQPPVTTTATTATPTTLVTSTTTGTTTSSTVTPTQTGGPGVPQWGQCGGRDYTGPTVCQAPYKCVFLSEWWSSCQ
ncbi:hypothetical protein RB595_010747 [Gaeumannomyces hyphopodioides]